MKHPAIKDQEPRNQDPKNQRRNPKESQGTKNEYKKIKFKGSPIFWKLLKFER